MENFIKEFFTSQVVESILVLSFSYIIYVILKAIIDKGMKKTKLIDKQRGKKATYAKLITNIIKYVFIIATILLVLQINGVNVTSMIAGLGIVGAITGLALQDALKDIIMGFNIITDDFFVVGDVVKYGDIEGKVVTLGLKTTKIQDIYTNNIISITNRNIDKITTVSNWLDIDVELSYNDKVETVDKALELATNEIKNIKEVQDCKYLGTNEFGDSGIYYKIRIYCTPEYKPNIKRDALRTIKYVLDENGLTIPYTQIDLHNI